MPAVGVAYIGAKGRDLDSGTGEGARRSTGFRDRHEHDSELLAHCQCLGKDLHDLLRGRVRGHIVVGRLAPKEQVADATSVKVSLVSALAQRAHDFGGVLFSVRQGRGLLHLD